LHCCHLPQPWSLVHLAKPESSGQPDPATSLPVPISRAHARQARSAHLPTKSASMVYAKQPHAVTQSHAVLLKQPVCVLVSGFPRCSTQPTATSSERRVRGRAKPDGKGSNPWKHVKRQRVSSRSHSSSLSTRHVTHMVASSALPQLNATH